MAVDDPSRVAAVKQSVAQFLGGRYKVQTRYEQNQSLYNVMGTEKWVIYIVLSLILVVAAFNMVGALTMLVWEKQKDIHVLKALGASNGLIQKIFLRDGFCAGAFHYRRCWHPGVLVAGPEGCATTHRTKKLVETPANDRGFYL